MASRKRKQQQESPEDPKYSFANCGGDHSLIRCLGPLDSHGELGACQFCNTMAHGIDQCGGRKARNVKGKFQTPCPGSVTAHGYRSASSGPGFSAEWPSPSQKSKELEDYPWCRGVWIQTLVASFAMDNLNFYRQYNYENENFRSMTDPWPVPLPDPSWYNDKSGHADGRFVIPAEESEHLPNIRPDLVKRGLEAMDNAAVFTPNFSSGSRHYATPGLARQHRAQDMTMYNSYSESALPIDSRHNSTLRDVDNSAKPFSPTEARPTQVLRSIDSFTNPTLPSNDRHINAGPDFNHFAIKSEPIEASPAQVMRSIDSFTNQTVPSNAHHINAGTIFNHFATKSEPTEAHPAQVMRSVEPSLPATAYFKAEENVGSYSPSCPKCLYCGGFGCGRDCKKLYCLCSHKPGHLQKDCQEVCFSCLEADHAAVDCRVKCCCCGLVGHLGSHCLQGCPCKGPHWEQNHPAPCLRLDCGNKWACTEHCRRCGLHHASHACDSMALPNGRFRCHALRHMFYPQEACLCL